MVRTLSAQERQRSKEHGFRKRMRTRQRPQGPGPPPCEGPRPSDPLMEAATK